MEAKLIEVISTWETRGDGSEKDPVRCVQSLWTLDGKLICELDPIRTRQAPRAEDAAERKPEELLEFRVAGDKIACGVFDPNKLAEKVMCANQAERAKRLEKLILDNMTQSTECITCTYRGKMPYDERAFADRDAMEYLYSLRLRWVDSGWPAEAFRYVLVTRRIGTMADGWVHHIILPDCPAEFIDIAEGKWRMGIACARRLRKPKEVRDLVDYWLRGDAVWKSNIREEGKQKGAKHENHD